MKILNFIKRFTQFHDNKNIVKIRKQTYEVILTFNHTYLCKVIDGDRYIAFRRDSNTGKIGTVWYADYINQANEDFAVLSGLVDSNRIISTTAVTPISNALKIYANSNEYKESHPRDKGYITRYMNKLTCLT